MARTSSSPIFLNSDSSRPNDRSSEGDPLEVFTGRVVEEKQASEHPFLIADPISDGAVRPAKQAAQDSVPRLLERLNLITHRLLLDSKGQVGVG